MEHEDRFQNFKHDVNKRRHKSQEQYKENSKRRLSK